MATVVQIENMQKVHSQKKFKMTVSLKDHSLQAIIRKFDNGSIWASDLTNHEQSDKELFKLYQFEDLGIVSSKIEHKKDTRYERRFYLTDLGRKLTKSQKF